MNHDERVLLFIAGAGLAAVILWRVSGSMREGMLTEVTGGTPIAAAGISQPVDVAQLSQGPEYLNYNMPWPFNPAVGNVVPTTSVGQAGQVESNPPSFISATSDCGCY